MSNMHNQSVDKLQKQQGIVSNCLSISFRGKLGDVMKNRGNNRACVSKNKTSFHGAGEIAWR